MPIYRPGGQPTWYESDDFIFYFVVSSIQIGRLPYSHIAVRHRERMAVPSVPLIRLAERRNFTAVKRLANDLVLKKQLLSRYLWPGMGLACGPDDPLTEATASACHRYEVVRGEHFELAGPFEAGQAYVFEHALSHSYYHYADTGDEQGVCIYRPHELIFDADSLLYRGDRLASLQALEPGGVLAIPYPALRQLMARHPALQAAMEALARQRERMMNELGRFLGMPAEMRFRQFRETHRPLLRRVPQRVQGLHINLSKTQFNRFLKKE